MVGKRKSAKKTEQDESAVKKSLDNKDKAKKEDEPAVKKTSDKDEAKKEDETSVKKVKSNKNGREKEDQPPPKKLRERKETKPEVNNSKPTSKNSPKKASKGREYEVEAIVDQRMKSGNQEFLIKWKGYGDNDNSWVAESNLNCQRLLEKFLKSKK